MLQGRTFTPLPEPVIWAKSAGAIALVQFCTPQIARWKSPLVGLLFCFVSYVRRTARSMLLKSHVFLKSHICLSDAMQMLGGNGYINEYPTGRIFRDAQLYRVGAGTQEIVNRFLLFFAHKPADHFCVFSCFRSVGCSLVALSTKNTMKTSDGLSPPFYVYLCGTQPQKSILMAQVSLFLIVVDDLLTDHEAPVCQID